MEQRVGRRSFDELENQPADQAVAGSTNRRVRQAKDSKPGSESRLLLYNPTNLFQDSGSNHQGLAH